MTDIDPAADIDIYRGFALVTARFPLTGHVSQEWLAAYNMLARKRAAHQEWPTPYNMLADDRDAQAVEAVGDSDRSWIIVRLPAITDGVQVQAVMDSARELIGEADAAEQAPQAAETEAAMRDWWARQHGSPDGR
jgi:hypothetical protein